MAFAVGLLPGSMGSDHAKGVAYGYPALSLENGIAPMAHLLRRDICAERGSLRECAKTWLGLSIAATRAG